MRLLLSLLFTTLLCTGVRAQNWTAFDAEALTGERRITPKQARTVSTDQHALHDLLFSAPHEKFVTAETSNTLLSLPLPTGGTATFRIVGYDISAAAALEKYPDIRTWYGVNEQDPTQSIFLDWTARGFHASVRGGTTEAFFIDPLVRRDFTHYQVYRKSDLDPADEPFTCQTDHDANPDDLPDGGAALQIGNCELMQYRLTITATGEYSNFHGATSEAQSALVQSAVVTTINRINQVTTRNLSLRMQLVGNNDLLYNYDPDNDPFPDNNVGSLINENTPYTTGIIGVDNYDFGNIFSQGGGGGVASLRASCVNSRKAAGATSLGSPEGDFFDVDYVAHEMGHNFGGNHTQNNGCNYSSSAGMEPGSGSTIMSYAGICSPNVQSQVDDYYHGRSIAEMTTHFELGNGGCGTIIDVSLNNATIDSPTDETIPAGTPFVLVSGASGNGTVNYNWEQYDVARGAVMPPVGTNQEGPLFRSLPATASPERYFPRLPDVINGTSGEWEATPTISREMNFRATVLNYNAAYGCAVEDDLTLDVTDANGPFTVLDPLNGSNQWSAGQTAQVRWDVAATNQAPINSQLMDVLISTDGGATFQVLLADTENDGYAVVTAPGNIGSQNRVMVRSKDNVFYNVSTADFSIVSGSGIPTVTVSPVGPTEITDCFAAVTSAEFSFVSTSAGGAEAPITWALTNAPADVTGTFSVNPNLPGGSFELLLDGLDNLPTGATTLEITGNSANGTFSETVTINRTGGDAGAGPAIQGPGTTEVELRPTLSASPQANATYEIQVSTTADFSTLVYAVSDLSDPTFAIPAYLSGNTTYFWRIRSTGSGDSSCGISQWSVASFETADCRLFSSTGASQPISDGPPPTNVEMGVMVPVAGTVTDVDVFELDIEHSYLGDLDIDLEHPDGTVVRLWDRDCGSQNNIFTSFDDDNNEGDAPCPPTTGNFYVSYGDPLSDFDGLPSSGLWTLRVADNADVDGGSLNGLTLKICLDDAQTLPVEWLTFTATGKKDHILLDWATGEEIANHGFTIERSSARQEQWSALGFVAAGADYLFADYTAVANTDYRYRLRQEDLDGSVSYSEIRTARFGEKLSGLTVFPNPAGNRLNYRLNSNGRPFGYQLLDVTGRVLQSGTLNVDGGTLDVSEFPAGVYLLRTEMEVLRVVKR